MKKILILFILYLFATESKSQIDTFFSDVAKGVVYLSGDYIRTEKLDGIRNYELFYKDTSGRINPILQTTSGTGFIVTYQGFLYIVTAQHIAEKLKFNAKVTFNNYDNTPVTIPLNDIQNRDSLAWYYHDSADVAVLPIHPNSILIYNSNYVKFDINLLQDSLVAPNRYNEVVAFGFPLNLGKEKNFSPISTSAKTASGIIDLMRFDRPKISSFFLLDAPSIPGLSGGPVFSLPSFYSSMYMRNDTAKIVGMVHGVISDNTGGKFAAVVPSKFIVETIKKTRRLDGKFTWKYDNGKIWSERIYNNGLLVEILSNYGPTGKPQDKGNLKNGNGEVKIYDHAGVYIATEVYKNGILIQVIFPGK